MLLAMDIQTIWIFVAAVSTPITGVVGFAIQLRQVEKARLENRKLKLELVKLAGDRDKMALELTKLALEIEHLQHQSNKTRRRIVVATNDQVAQFNDMDIKFSRKGQRPTVFRTETSTEPPTARAQKPRAVPWALTATGIALLAFLAWAYWPR